MPTLFVTDRSNAEILLTKNFAKALVSCHNPVDGHNGNFPNAPCVGFESFSGHKIAFDFADSSPTDRFDGQHAATEGQIKNLLTWGDSVRALEGVVLVHCNAGIGRSPAVAFILQCLWDGEDIRAERSLATALAGCETGPMPNEHIVKLGDSLLSRNKQMLWAVQVWNDNVASTQMY